MRKLAAVLVILSACQAKTPDNSAEMQRLRTENARLTKEVSDARIETIEAQKEIVRKNDLLIAAGDKIKELMAARPPAATSPITETVYQPVQSRPASQSTYVAAATPYQAPAPTRAPEQERQTITNDPVIKNHCEAEWHNDYRMIAYCEKQQVEAKAKLDQGNTYGFPVDIFLDVRRGCAGEWPNDYKMQVYCEGQQYSGWKQTDPMKR